MRKNFANICFHSVAFQKDPRWYKSFLTIELTFFDSFIKYLLRSGYAFLSYDEFLYINSYHNNKNTKVICLTFDDGYLDNYVFAFPVLKKYKIKGTLFISPDFIQNNKTIRKNLEDVWANNCKLEELETLGFVSWEELRIMQSSGVMDIQSHTMTHTRYFASDRIIDFHNPNSDYLNPISNLFPEKKPYYIADLDFKHLIPYGTPFFEERSAVVVRKVSINQDFTDECVSILNITENSNYNFGNAFKQIEGVYNKYRDSNQLIEKIETEEEYKSRVYSELEDSKRIIEEKLGKKVYHLCWPHGIYNEFSLEVALKVGYKTASVFYAKNYRLPEITLIRRKEFHNYGNSLILSNILNGLRVSLFDISPASLWHRKTNNK